MSAISIAPANPILDLAKPLAERQLARLERLAEIGMAIAEKLHERMEAAGPEDDLSGLTMAFNRVSRAVRVTDMLQTRVLTDLDRQLREAAHRADQAEAHDQRLAEGQRKADIERTVERLAQARHSDDEDAVDRIVIECGERLDREDYGWILARPIDEILGEICRDLGLPPEQAVEGPSPFPLDKEGARDGGDGSPLAPPAYPQISAPPTSRPVFQPRFHDGGEARAPSG